MCRLRSHPGLRQLMPTIPDAPGETIREDLRPCTRAEASLHASRSPEWHVPGQATRELRTARRRHRFLPVMKGRCWARAASSRNGFQTLRDRSHPQRPGTRRWHLTIRPPAPVRSEHRNPLPLGKPGPVPEPTSGSLDERLPGSPSLRKRRRPPSPLACTGRCQRPSSERAFANKSGPKLVSSERVPDAVRSGGHNSFTRSEQFDRSG